MSFNNQFVTVLVPVQISLDMYEKMNINSFCKTNDNQSFPILSASQLFNEINKSNQSTATTASMRTNDNVCCATLPVIKNICFESYSTFNHPEEQSCFARANQEVNSEIQKFVEQDEELISQLSSVASISELVNICFRRVRERENRFVKVFEACVFELLQDNVAINKVNFNNGFGWDNNKNCFDRRSINNEGFFGIESSPKSTSSLSSCLMRSIITSSIISIYEKAFIISMQSLFSCLLQVLLSTTTTTTTTTISVLEHHGNSHYEKKSSYSTFLKHLNMYHLQLVKQYKPQPQQYPHPQQQSQQQQQQQQFVTVF